MNVEAGSVVRTWRGGFEMPLLTVIMVVAGAGSMAGWHINTLLYLFRLATPLMAGATFAALMAIWVLIRRRVTLTTDTLIVVQWRRTYRLPLRDITEIVHTRATKGQSFWRQVSFRTGDKKKWANALSLGLSPKSAMDTIADAVVATGAPRPKLVY